VTGATPLHADPAVLAAGCVFARDGQGDIRLDKLLAELSHHDPDHHPLAAEVQAEIAR